MNLHIFNDRHGFNLNIIVHRFKNHGALENNIFINLNNRSIYKNKTTTYLKGNIPGYRQAIRQLPLLETVSFYPFDYHAAYFLRELRRIQPEIKVNWVFWSYEYYHQPFLYPGNLDEFSLAYYRNENNMISRSFQKLKYFVKQGLRIPVYNRELIEQSYLLIQGFYSFLPQDFRNVSAGSNALRCPYHPISFLSMEEIIKNVRIDKRISPGEIMIGHAASLTANHKEVMDKLAGMKISNPIFIPLEYGVDQYGAAIKDIAVSLFGDRVQFLQQRLDLAAYYQRLSSISFAIFNFKSQEALGNIIFLLWNGTKIFLREESSPYQQFRDWGFAVYSIEKDLNEKNLENALSPEIADENRRKSEELFAESKIDSYWRSLM